MAKATAAERFWAKVNFHGPICERLGTRCWLWTASTDGTGYGKFVLYPGGGRKVYVPAHRFAYELVHGQRIPADKRGDHLCFVPRCVNPGHLRAVTNKQNIEHRQGANSNSRSGVRGVWFDPRRGQWIARVRHERKAIFVGRFDTVEAAKAAVIARRNELFTHNDVDRRTLTG